MKKKLLLLLAIVSFYSCTFWYNVTLNGEKKYMLISECGKIEVKAKCLKGQYYHLEMIVIDGKYNFYPNNLSIEIDSAHKLEDLFFSYQGVLIDAPIQLKKNETPMT